VPRVRVIVGPRIIGIPIYPQVDLLDVAAPREMLNHMKALIPGTDVWLIAEDDCDVVTRDGTAIRPEKTFDDVPRLDVLWVPSGDPSALKAIINDPERTCLDFLVSRTAHAKWVTSVCEGALLLAAAGLLEPRFVVDGNRLTGGGISSGLDEALKLIELLNSYDIAQQVQQFTQYYPAPPVASVIQPADTCPMDA
jgi:cyclohexyl-isocyanide hydratase